MGAAPGVAQDAKTILEQRYAGLQVIGTACPFWKPGETFDQAVLDEIKALQPDILLVALGNPKQELWIKTYGAEVGVPVQIGVGASLDFIVGRTKRAPRWMQRSGLEWVARLVQEPRRLWKRYMFDAVRFAPSLLRQWWLMRPAAQTNQSCSVEMRSIGHLTIMNIKGGFTRFHSQKVRDAGERALHRQANLTINLADVTNLDCNAIGTLMSLRKMAEETGSELRVVGIQKPLQRIFDMLNLALFFELDESSLVLGLR
jgi:N-acetylglucosaminyldiphosphoundecaprenol N-acetyl-beta-D-mannosaminyltransferase